MLGFFNIKVYHKRQPFILIQENTGAEGTTNPNGETTPTNAGSETPESGATTPPETGPTSPTEETTPQAGNQKPPTGIMMLKTHKRNIVKYILLEIYTLLHFNCTKLLQLHLRLH